MFHSKGSRSMPSILTSLMRWLIINTLLILTQITGKTSIIENCRTFLVLRVRNSDWRTFSVVTVNGVISTMERSIDFDRLIYFIPVTWDRF